MPYISEKKKMPTRLKKSAKLTPEDKEEIRYRYLKIGGVSQRELAKEYNVSRRSIQFAIYPEKQKENYQKRVDRGGSKQYYDKEKNTEAVRRSRQRKHQLFKEGKIS
jgi:transposase